MAIMAQSYSDDPTHSTFTLFPRRSSEVVSHKIFPNRRSFPLVALSTSIGFFIFVWIYFFALFYTPPPTEGRQRYYHGHHHHHHHHHAPRIQHVVHSPSFRRTIIENPLAIFPQPKDLTLLLTITNDTTSWGSLTIASDRVFTFEDFISRIQAQEVPAESLHLGLLTSDIQEYNHYVTVLSRLTPIKMIPWAKAEIIYLEKLPGMNEGMQVGEKESKSKVDLAAAQTERKRYMARLRNFLSSHMLTPEVEHVVWLDPDVYELPPGLFKRFQELGRISADDNIDDMVKAGIRETGHTIIQDENDGNTVREAEDLGWSGYETKTEDTLRIAPPIGLITLRCQSFDHPDYDRSAWSGFGRRPPNWELNNILRGTEYPGMESWAKAISQLIIGTDNNDIVKLDSVGATSLYIRANLLREGLVFPVHSVAGAEWGQDGRDGIGSEGLCYIAERLGWGCYALGGTWRTLHADE
ncbi:hypothetical protein TWF481_000203 [Arthrobotrys musiformis]|uniref:Glycosyltransferase family 62 protein n=1 Tax=Arthrobotrys musiformis TaxID=47236 RepID=A0AAV9WLZ0_9PEZI